MSNRVEVRRKEDMKMRRVLGDRDEVNNFSREVLMRQTVGLAGGASPTKVAGFLSVSLQASLHAQPEIDWPR